MNILHNYTITYQHNESLEKVIETVVSTEYDVYKFADKEAHKRNMVVVGIKQGSKVKK